MVILPTSIDAGVHKPVNNEAAAKDIIIGWTGSHSTLKYLDPLMPLLKKLAAKKGVRIRIICNQPPVHEFPGLEFIPWSAQNEISDLAAIDIGIMPLQQDAWSEGKCGFKLIQYMAMGIAPVASPVGVNASIIDEGENGYLCETPGEWEQRLAELIDDVEKRKRFGRNGREKIVGAFSTQANAPLFLALFD